MSVDGYTIRFSGVCVCGGGGGGGGGKAIFTTI